VTYQSQVAVSASTSWFDGSLAGTAPLLLSTQRLVQGTAKYLEELGRGAVVTGRDHIYARPATELDASELGVAPGTAILHGENWFFDADGVVIEFGEYVTTGDRGRTYTYRLDRA
jgi:DNA-binding GntR family transcriptional regulator